MTAIKVNTEHKTILDFSNIKVSHSVVMSKLKAADFLEFKSSDKGSRTYISYDIKIGIYTIFVDLLSSKSEGMQSCAKKLKDYNIHIHIYEGNKAIDLTKDNRFASEIWLSSNKKFNLKPSHLASAITFCSRLNDLKAFL